MEDPFTFLPNTENSPLNWITSLFNEDEPNKSKNKKKKNNNNSYMGGNKNRPYGPVPYKDDNAYWGTKYGQWGWFARIQLSKPEEPKYSLDVEGVVRGRSGVEHFILADPATGELAPGRAKDAQAWRMDYGNLNVTDVPKFTQLLIKAGYLPADYKATKNPTSAFVQAMMDASREVSAMNIARFGDGSAIVGKPLTLQQGLNIIAGGGGKDGGAGSSTYTSLSYTSFSDAEARGILENFYADALGRRPNNKEVAKFKNVINAAAKKRPSVSTTVSSGNTSTNTSNEGYSQADAELTAREMAEAKPGANAFITSTKFMDTFLGILGGKIGRI